MLTMTSALGIVDGDEHWGAYTDTGETNISNDSSAAPNTNHILPRHL